MRHIPVSFDPSVVAAVDERLSRAEREHSVVIPWAIESGSRAWGFPSPDSDYDCRFLFVRLRDDYLSLSPGRDVLETPLDSVFDVNGWDLAKAMKLMLKGNAVVVEWLRSPIVYRGDEGFRGRLLEVAEAVGDRALTGRHYLHVALNQLHGHSLEDIPLKRMLYATRNAVTLRWLRINREGTTPPMELSTLLDEAVIDVRLRREIEGVVERKALINEMGRGVFPLRTREFVLSEIALAQDFEGARNEPDSHRLELANRFFVSEVERWNSRATRSLG